MGHTRNARGEQLHCRAKRQCEKDLDQVTRAGILHGSSKISPILRSLHILENKPDSLVRLLIRNQRRHWHAPI